MEKIRAAYEQESGVKLRIQYGGSGTLLSNLQVARSGDLYLAADQSYLDIARDKGLVAETIPIATLRPVIAVPTGNPRGIASLADLCHDDISLALANADAAAIGKLTHQALAAGCPVIDLRRVCNERSDYFNPIEPNEQGGGKIAEAIVDVLTGL